VFIATFTVLGATMFSSLHHLRKNGIPASLTVRSS